MDTTNSISESRMTAALKWKGRRRPIPDFRSEADAIMAMIRSRSLIDPFTGCWIWQRGKNALGYGHAHWKGRTWMANRLVLAVKIGPFDENLDCCHSCHVRSCVNPDHLRADEHQANLMDGSRDKRLQGQWKTHCKRGHPLIPENLTAAHQFRHCKICDKLRHQQPHYKAKAVARQRAWRQKRRRTST